MIRAFFAVCIVALCISTARGDDWPNYRGPNRDGVSAESGWTSDWPAEGPARLWRFSAGTGASGVVVSQGKLYTVGNVKGFDSVWCLNADTGEKIWKFTYAAELADNDFTGGPRATPTVDAAAGRVYMLSQEGLAVCLDAASGERVWSTHLVRDHGGSRPHWGYAGSPLVLGDRVILDAGGKGSSTVALDKSTGKLLWKAGDDDAGYASPVPMKIGETQQVVLFKSSDLVGVSAEDGRELWRVHWPTDWGVNIATPLVLGDRVYISSTTGKGGNALVRVTPAGVTTVWKDTTMKSHTASAVVVGEQLYGFSEHNQSAGLLRCLDVATGQYRWGQPQIGNGALIASDGRLIAITERGELLLIKATPERFTVLARTQVLGAKCWVEPVLANGRLYCKNNKGELVALDVRK